MSTIAITVEQGVATWSADTVDALSGFHDSKVGVSPPSQVTLRLCGSWHMASVL